MKISAILLLLTTLMALPAVAAPKRATKKGAVPASKAAAAKAPKADPQALVSAGKRPAFFNPKDLSKPPARKAPAAILMDADTGQVLWSKNPDQRRAPASTTKIMTALLFIENTKPEDVITCMNPAIAQIEESSLHIKPWEKFSAEDLLYGLLLRSANDGAVVVAEHVAGSVPAFAKEMTARAKQIGANNTNFVNPNGLPGDAHYSTARDLGLIACEALKNPRFADAVGTPKRVIQRSKVAQDSIIVARVKRYFYDKFPGADGVKTGYTRKAGHCFVGSATRDGRRLLTVILGAKNSASADTIPLLSWGFKRFPAVVMARKGEPAGNVSVPATVDGAVSVVADANLHATFDSLRSDKFQIKPEVRPAPGLAAPIRKGQQVGTMNALVNGVSVAEVKLLAAEDAAVAPLPAAIHKAGSMLPGTLAGVGGLGVLLIAWRYGTTSAKGARRRRNRLASARGGNDRGGSGLG